MKLRARNSTKAVIVQDGKLLVIKYRNPREKNPQEYYGLPGGGQIFGEALEQALYRECQEEINVDVEVKELLFVREYIGQNHNAKEHSHIHQVEFFFRCTIRSGIPGIGHEPDTEQVGVAWLALDELEQANFYPRGIRKTLATLLTGEMPSLHRVYLGDLR